MKRLIKILTFGFLSLVGMALPTLVFSDDYWIPGSGSGAPVEISTTYADDTPLYFGTSDDALITYSTLASPDSWVMGVGADSNILYIAEKADYATVWNRSAPANPTVCIQSADAATQAQRICLSHNQTNGVIDVDSGSIQFADPTIISGGTIDAATIGGTTVADGSFSTINVKNGASTIVNAKNTDPDAFSGDLVQIQLTANGGGTITGSADTYRLIRGDITLTTGTQSDVFTAAHFQSQTSGSASSTGTGGSGIRGLIASAIHNSTGTAASLVGLNSNAAVGANGSSISAGTVTTIQGNRVTTGYVSGFNGTGLITNNYGVIVVAPQNTSSGSSRLITNFYGIYVDDTIQSGVTNGYSIYTGTGRVRFGGNIEFGTGVITDTTLYGISRNADSPNALEYYIPASRIHKWTIAGGTEMTLSATALDINNNALSNIGASGTDFANGGALVIGPDASASGTPALNLTQAGHTAITSSQPALNISPFTQTVNSGSTVTRGTAAEFAAPTFQGVAGGGTETATDIYTVYIAGPGIVGANLANTAVGSLWVDAGDVRFDGLLQFTPQVVTVADDGAGTPALVTITPNSGNIQVTCNDVNGCNVTMSETGAKNGVSIRLVNMSANNVVFADTGGVSELAGGFTAGQYDTICMTYQSDRWVENSRANN